MANVKATSTVSCPALFLSAPASGQGKTTVTSALARHFKNQGKNVRVFKTGPDYLDPQILQQASGHFVESLDMWMAGEAWCRKKLYEAAQSSDLILIEGAMGLFDGEPSSADLAAKFGIPVALVLDVKGMAQTVGAVVSGLASYRDDFKVIGLIGNKCGSQRHAELIEIGLPIHIPLLATLARDEDVALPERHLGLVQACEVFDELELKIENGAKKLAAGGLASLEEWLSPVTFHTPPHVTSHSEVKAWLAGITIGIAQDTAFSFIYQSNVRLLQQMGANIEFFSPMSDASIPNVDALWLPGGYPELHAQVISRNTSMLNSIQRFFNANKPILAECGGLLYCLQTLSDLDENIYPMLGLLAGQGSMSGKRGCQGMQTAQLPEGEVRAHAHHRSRCVNTPTPIAFGRRQKHPAPGEAIYRHGSLTASYLHLFFPSNAWAVACLFNKKLMVADSSLLKNEESEYAR
jgi:cobyrinic acid a,c-diamide synthase